MEARTSKYKLGARAGKYKSGVGADKYKSGARAGKYKLGARAGGREIQTPLLAANVLIYWNISINISIMHFVTSCKYANLFEYINKYIYYAFC